MKTFNTARVILTIAIMGLWVGMSEAENIEVTDLRCEYLTNPLGIDVAKPQLSWGCQSNQRGQKQRAYRVLVADSREEIDKNIGNLWDSGKVTSEQSLNIGYGGEPIKSCKQYFWKVRVWDKDDKGSEWSGVNFWGTGFVRIDDWKGQWIKSDLELYDYQKELKKVEEHSLELEKMDDGKDIRVRAKEVRKMTAEVTEAPAVWMRREFKTKGKKPSRAILYISGLGLYEPYLNGSRIDDYLLRVAPYDFSKSVPYDVYDVTGMIEKEGNVLGVILANGYFNPVIPSLLREYAFDFIDTPRLRCELRLEYDDGARQAVISDASWKFTTAGPIRFNSIRSGETYDARKELGDWSGAGYNDKDWKKAIKAEGPAGRLVHRYLPPVRVIQKIPAVSVKAYEKGYRFDIGIESTGWARIKVRGKAGQKIIIQYPGADSHTLGRYQTCEYICKGKGEEIYEPRFAFNGYRYVDVYGLDYKPEVTDLVGLQVVSDLQSVGSFSCSDKRIDYLQEVNRRTIRNYNVLVPLDPVREKVCWTQDVQSNFETSAYNFNLYSIYRKWQYDYIESILENGFVPTVVPSCFDGPGINGPWWGGMIIFNPWQLYNFYGDENILAQSYEAMKDYFGYLGSIAKNNVIEWGLGDWMDLASGGYGLPRGTTVAYTSTCGYMMYADILQKTALLLDEKKDADHFASCKEEIRRAINKTFYNEKTGVYEKGSQTAYILALKLNIPLKKDRARVIQNFRKQIGADNDHLSTGFIGTPFLLTLLNEEGLGDLAWKIATQESYPSWYDMIFNKNNSVFKENWQGGLVQMPSLAGPIGAWFYRSLGGIRPDKPGYKSFIVAPYTKTLDWVKCEYECPYGLIVSNWSKKDNVLTMEVNVPVNTTATICVPGKNITEGGLPGGDAEGVSLLHREKDTTVFKVESGKYELKSMVK